jgi:hypothetical protein
MRRCSSTCACGRWTGRETANSHAAMMAISPYDRVTVWELARGYRYIDVPSPTLTEAHEEVFLNMRLRKMDRQGNGPREKGGKWHLVLLGICLVLALSAGHLADGGISSQTVTLSYGEIAIIAAWLFAVSLPVHLPQAHVEEHLLMRLRQRR